MKGGVKTMKLIIISILLTLLFLSCDLLEQKKNEYLVFAAPVLRVTIDNKSSNQISFNAKASWPDGCGQYDHSEITQNSSIYYIKVFGKEKKGSICTQAFIEFDAPISIQNISTGTHTFRFWYADTLNIDTVIVFQ